MLKVNRVLTIQSAHIGEIMGRVDSAIIAQNLTQTSSKKLKMEMTMVNVVEKITDMDVAREENTTVKSATQVQSQNGQHGPPQIWLTTSMLKNSLSKSRFTMLLQAQFSTNHNTRPFYMAAHHYYGRNHYFHEADIY